MAPVVPQHCGDTLIFDPRKGWLPKAIPLAITGSKNSNGFSYQRPSDCDAGEQTPPTGREHGPCGSIPPGAAAAAGAIHRRLLSPDTLTFDVSLVYSQP